jgi:ABC-type hemin transport system substrate-binding protein
VTVASDAGGAPLLDATGTAHPPAGPGARIVSLVPSLTELVCDLGLGDRLVGRTHYCIHPQDRVSAVTSVGGTKKVRFDRLMALRPTHVLVNVDETPKALADRLAAEGVSVVVTHPNAPLDNLALYELIGGLFGRAERAAALAERFRAAHDRLAAAASGRPRRRVLYLIWKDPWMTVSRDTYIARTLALAGWDAAVHDPAVRYPQIAMDAATLAGVDLVLASSEPYPFTEADAAALAAELGPAGPRAAWIDGEMVSWYGSRAIAGLDYLHDLAARLAD